MRDDLAEKLLSRVMGWDTSDVKSSIPYLQAQARLKYDEYGNYGPGAKFLENLAGWLGQFPPERRDAAFKFVIDELVFISEREMSHLITLVPTEIVVPVLRSRIATEIGVHPYRIAELEARPEFVRLRRSSLIIGASDGAKLDRLRRSSSNWSHEQFSQGTEPDLQQLERMAVKLAEVIDPLETGEEEVEPKPFAHVFFVDDFSGSGETLIRQKTDGAWSGKLPRLRRRLSEAAEKGLVVPDVPVTVVLYCASEKAVQHLHSSLASIQFANWEVRTIVTLPESCRVDLRNQGMASLCSDFFDPSTEDAHKGQTPLGYSDCALPIVLAHNTPNNSICLLWMDTRDVPESRKLHGLFPRYERHHSDRP
jgi:hypothetical protein